MEEFYEEVEGVVKVSTREGGWQGRMGTMSARGPAGNYPSCVAAVVGSIV